MKQSNIVEELLKNYEKGRITRKSGSPCLYFDFVYHGKRVEKSTGLVDSEENRDKARAALTELIKGFKTGVITFSAAFPSASEQEKAYFSLLENRSYCPEPWDVLVGSYADKWIREIVENFDAGKRHDYLQALNDWILPFFKDKTFYDITNIELKRFIAQLKWRDTKNKGKKLSGSRVRNIFIPLRKMWHAAWSEHHWQFSLVNPFIELAPEDFPKKSKKGVQVFHFDDWANILKNMDTFYRPVSEIMIMTGMIGSEIAGLRKADLTSGVIEVENKRVIKRKKEGGLVIEEERLKTDDRPRRIPITAKLERLFQEVLKQKGPEYEYVFSMKDGSRFNPDNFREGAWETAFRKSGLEYVRPYAMRHSFAGWSMTMRMDPGRLAYLMGHSTKKMVYERYGKYEEDLEKEAPLMLDYFGRDFIEKNFNKNFYSFLNLSGYDSSQLDDKSGNE